MFETRERVRRLSRRMEWLASAIAATTGLVLLYGLWLLLFDPQEIGRIAAAQFADQRQAIPFTLSSATLLLLAFAFAAQAAIFLWALLALRRAFAAMAEGEVVSAAAARLMRLAGVGFLVNSAAMVVWRPLTSLILSIDMPAGQRFLTIGFGTPELMALLVSGVLIAFGHLIAVAAAVDDENRRFI